MLFFNRKLFREQAVASKWKSEPLDGLLRVTAPHEWMLVAGFSLTLLGVLAWGVFGRVERSVLADCVVARSGERLAVLAGAPGTIAEVLTAPGVAVAAGQPLARMRMPDLHWQARIAEARVALLETRRAGESPPSQDMLFEAQAELRELAAIAAAGELIVSPQAGEVTALDLTPGQALATGAEVARILTGPERRWETLAFIPPEAARRLQVGMTGRILLAAPGDRPVALEAEVSEVSPPQTAAPRWLTELGLRSGSPGAGHLVRATVREPADTPLGDGAACRLRIVTGRHAPVLLLAPAWNE